MGVKWQEFKDRLTPPSRQELYERLPSMPSLPSVQAPDLSWVGEYLPQVPTCPKIPLPEPVENTLNFVLEQE